MQTLSRAVTVTSDPPGATIWTKEGRVYACTSTSTPATVQLTFHGENDVKEIVLRRFGYASQKLSLDAAHDRATASLVAWGAPFFTPSGDVPPEVRSLDSKLKKEFEETLIAGGDAFPCTPFEFRSIGVVKSDERHQLELGVLVVLGPSSVAKNLRVAGHNYNNSEDRLRQIGRVALEGGLAQIIARFRDIAAKPPEIKGVFLACSYSTTESALETQFTPYTHTVLVREPTVGTVESHLEQRAVQDWQEATVVKDQAAVRTLTVAVPLAKIPATADAKAVTAAVLSEGSIKDLGTEDLLPLLSGAPAKAPTRAEREVDEYDHNQSSEPVPSDANATVYVFRDHSLLGAALKPPIYCDNVELAQLQNGRYFRVRLEPGRHILRSKPGAPGITLVAAPAGVYYIHAQIVQGGSLSLTPLQSFEPPAAMHKMKALDKKEVMDPSRVAAKGEIPDNPTDAP